MFTIAGGIILAAILLPVVFVLLSLLWPIILGFVVFAVAWGALVAGVDLTPQAATFWAGAAGVCTACWGYSVMAG